MSGKGSVQKNLQSLSAAQLQDLHGVLQKPISGRQVMIPLTSKSFVVGSLQPNKDDTAEEQVLIRDGKSSELKEMSRASACKLLEEQKLKKKMPKAKKTLKSALKSSTRKDSVESTKKNGDSGSATRKTVTVSAAKKPLSYFDIKEEIDGTGKIVKSEAVNVTKQLDFVSKQIGESKEEEKEEGPKESASEDYKDQMDVDDHEEDINYQEIPVDEDDNRPPVSDDDYESLSARLEELARLEEEDEKKQKANQLSARELISQGWTKGFLAGKKTTPAQAAKEQTSVTTVPSVPTAITKESSAIQQKPAATNKVKESKGWSKGFFNKPSNTSKAIKKATNQVDSSTAIPGPDSSKKVSFQESAPDIREIPRIGEKSASLLKKPSPPVNNPTAVRSGEANPFDSSVVSDVVKEHHVGEKPAPLQASNNEPKKRLSKFALERQQQQGGSSSSQDSQPKKRISKFAQERQQIR